MTSAPLASFKAAAYRCAATMQESASFITQELASIEVPDPHQRAIREVCDAFMSNWFDIRTELAELSELGLPDYAPSVRQRVDRIFRWLDEHRPELHGVVTALSSAAKDDQRCASAYILVAESATNVLITLASVADTRKYYLEAYARESGA